VQNKRHKTQWKSLWLFLGKKKNLLPLLHLLLI